MSCQVVTRPLLGFFFTSAVHLADKNEHPIAGLHESHLSTVRRNNALFDRCYLVPVIGRHIAYRLPISVMKRQGTVALTESFCMCLLVSSSGLPDERTNYPPQCHLGLRQPMSGRGFDKHIYLSRTKSRTSNLHSSWYHSGARCTQDQ